MKTEISLENMSHSIAYWYTAFSNAEDEETIFPIQADERDYAYRILRMQYSDADVIVSPQKKIYQINKDVFVEREKESCMVFVEDISNNKSKRKMINAIQPYCLGDEDLLKINDYVSKLFSCKVSFSVIIFTFKFVDDPGTVLIKQAVDFLKGKIRGLSYLNLDKKELIRGTDVIASINDNQLFVILTNIDENNANKKAECLNKLVKEYFKTSIDTDIFMSSDYGTNLEMKKHVKDCCFSRNGS